MRRLWGVLVVVLVLAGCSVERTGGAPDRADAPSGPFDLETPIELARATEEPSASATALPQPDGAPLHVEVPFLTITRLDRAEVELQPGQTNWSLLVTLTEDDGAVFSQWTEEHTGERAAILVDGEIVSAPTIVEPIPGREVVISAQFTRDEAEALLNRITGR